MSTTTFRRTILAAGLACAMNGFAEDRLTPIKYNNPGLVVDLGVGLWAWPLPMDYDGDGDLDLVVSCPDKPYNGTYFFENPGSVKSGVDGSQPPIIGRQPVFKPPVRIADGPTNVQVCTVDGRPVVMTPGKIYADFPQDQYSKPIKLPLPDKIDPKYQRYRANQWKLVDWEEDGDLDVIIGIEIWDDYGWDDAWNEKGDWKNGPLHGFVYLVENLTNPQEPIAYPSTEAFAALATAKFAPPRKLTTEDGNLIDVFGMPSPNFADFDGDGDLDLICGEFLDGFTWFENIGTRSEPDYAPGRRLGSVAPADPEDKLAEGLGSDGIRMNLQMITPVAIDWDGDGDLDLICGDEDGRVAFIERLSEVERLPELTSSLLGLDRLQSPAFAAPVYLKQQADEVKIGALATPFGVDWDGDGDVDIVCGNTAGDVVFLENFGGNPPRWAAPAALEEYFCLSATCGLCDRYPIRHQAGPRGSIQGPCEAKWGYTTLSVVDWDHDGLNDLVTNNIWGRVEWNRRRSPDPKEYLDTRASVGVAWTGPIPKPQWTWWTPDDGELATQWRTTPCAVDWNGDGLTDLVMLDPEGYLAFYERRRAEGVSLPSISEPARGADAPRSPENNASRAPDDLVLLPPKRLFKIAGPCEFDSRHKPVGDKKDDLLRLNAGRAGGSGRRKLSVVDWDGDGRLDLLVNSVNVNWLRNVRTDDEGFTWFEDQGQLDDRVLAGHDTAPTTVDWDGNGIPDLLVGAEDGRLYFKRNPRAVSSGE